MGVSRDVMIVLPCIFLPSLQASFPFLSRGGPLFSLINLFIIVRSCYPIKGEMLSASSIVVLCYALAVSFLFHVGALFELRRRSIFFKWISSFKIICNGTDKQILLVL